MEDSMWNHPIGWKMVFDLAVAFYSAVFSEQERC